MRFLEFHKLQDLNFIFFINCVVSLIVSGSNTSKAHTRGGLGIGAIAHDRVHNSRAEKYLAKSDAPFTSESKAGKVDDVSEAKENSLQAINHEVSETESQHTGSRVCQK